MNTTNLISTPAITGNIGSCTTNVEQVTVKSGLSQRTGYTIATNSCSGEVTKTDFTTLNGGIFIVIFAVLFFIGFVIAALTN